MLSSHMPSRSATGSPILVVQAADSNGETHDRLGEVFDRDEHVPECWDSVSTLPSETRLARGSRNARFGGGGWPEGSVSNLLYDYRVSAESLTSGKTWGMH